MDTFQNDFDSIRQLLIYKEYGQLTKRIIDLTLDTGDIKYYQNTLGFLDWLDANENSEEKGVRYSAMLDDLYNCLNQKECKEDQESTLINVDNLVKSYGGRAFQLGPINLALKNNQMVGLVGENGNGKTTLLRVLCGELETSAGHVDYNFKYEDEYDLRSKLVYIPQRTPVWQGTLLANLQFAASCYGIKGMENLLTVELIIARMGIRQFRTYGWGRLSSGYKMRFELARALLRNPKVLLIDEPLANLDILAQKNVLDDLKGIIQSPFRPMGILLSSQQLYDVEKNADEVIFLKNGSQKNLINQTDNIEQHQQEELYIVEFETTWNLEEVKECLGVLTLVDMQLNGGTYVASFSDNITQDIFLQNALKVGMPIGYFRDISKSTRRFFLS